MLSTRTLVLGLASVAVAVAGVWWLQQQQQQHHNKHLPDAEERPRPGDKKPEKKRRQSAEKAAKPSPVVTPVADTGAGGGGASVGDTSASAAIVDANNVAVVEVENHADPFETPVPTTPPQSALVADVEVTEHVEDGAVDDGTVSANVTVRKKSQNEILPHDEDFPESSPIAYDPDRVCGETTVLDSVTTLESLEASAVLHDSMVTSLPEIMGDETQSDVGREEEEEEDVHVITADDIDESTSAFDLSTSALDMSTSALEESKENIHTSVDAEQRIDEIEQAESDAGPEQKAQKTKPKRKRNKNKASDSFANSSVDVNDSINGSPAESPVPVRAAAASSKPKPSNQTSSGGKALSKKRSYRVKK